MMKFAKIWVFTILVGLLVGVYLMSTMSVRRYLRTQDLILTVSPMSAKSALRNFQDESRMDLLQTGGSMSANYSNYISWLRSCSDFLTIADELQSKYADGITPMNFALPYVDPDKLEVEFQTLLDQQLTNFSKETYCEIVDIQGSVKNVEKSINNFSTRANTWGIGSGFYTNTSGHTMLYDYSNYVTYNITFEVDITVKNRFGFMRLYADDQHIKGDFNILYELMN